MLRSLWARRHSIAITMAVLILLAQFILSLHSAMHLAKAGQDHCEVVKASHSFAAQLPSISFQFITLCFHYQYQVNGLPALAESEPHHGPPIRAPPFYG